MQPSMVTEVESLWYLYKSQVWDTETEPANTVHNIMRVLRSIRGFDRLAYVSVPITSGRHLYDLKLTTPRAAGRDLLDLAITHNYLEGWKFAESLTGRLSYPVLFPADLTPAHQDWEQIHFQALWLSIIAEKCTEVRMSKDWQFSNGGCEEFTHTMQLKLGIPRSEGKLIFLNTKGNEATERERMRSIRVYDHTGNELTPLDGISLMHNSLAWITDHGFQAPKIARCLELLEKTSTLIAQGFYQ